MGGDSTGLGEADTVGNEAIVAARCTVMEHQVSPASLPLPMPGKLPVASTASASGVGCQRLFPISAACALQNGWTEEDIRVARQDDGPRSEQRGPSTQSNRKGGRTGGDTKG